MQKIIVAGAGRIGSLIATLLATVDEYEIHLLDSKSESFNSDLMPTAKAYRQVVLDVTSKQLDAYIKKEKITALVSCLPYTANIALATLAKNHHLHYFDLTEDIQVSAAISQLAHHAETAFVPQCGVAPGFISIVANELMKSFTSLESVYLRVGALPKHTNHALKYALTWSPEGLINEYANPCNAIVNGQLTQVQPLEDLESIEIDGLHYEAFNTSGGLGTLAMTYQGKVNTLNYKTIRYPGHCEKMRFLMIDLKLSHARESLKTILLNALPQNAEDVVLIYVAVKGNHNQTSVEKNYVKKFYPQVIAGKTWSAIQITTASSASAVIDEVLQNPKAFKGLIKQENFALEAFLKNRFGSIYKNEEDK
ncbi:saccharopine dehydrogenase family protein [Candidatus Berkiella aquae]|uniref:Lysine 6-dehydrogenase n=1 Tax=Candidatus Berkiella aquae TaxID=295108 RepID=A0A0Q9YI77_9GAMM|nr:saccharopine dehydrogenase C-terminal domain-containing protein [Candidatus Berkiella aquae]MCS5712276.1 saccharopine dehydrogenase NADP-binding domain-containing protein [Candidatus Berkiella aquae]